MIKDALPSITYLKDYTPPYYLVDEIEFRFDLREGATKVSADMKLRRNALYDTVLPLVLNGVELKLLELSVNDRILSTDEYSLTEEELTIAQVPDFFMLKVVTEIYPEKNTTLEGLYQSDGMYCTQCEAEGFRRITFFPDRPDVMSRYRVTIEADKTNYPVLLSNGNRIDSGDLDNNRHWATWEDPYPKPCYLFALVAGDLACEEDEFVTRSRRHVQLQLFVEKHDLDKCSHALESLKRAMKWDEDVYGREYDLDIYMIVAVSHFNMGAMENKGLNIFNAACVLAKPETATDDDFDNIESIIGHEYFHNWSGNRVTCRDWFQLSLKEGFTVFRDQEFSADMGSRAVKRISDVNVLRTAQFAEDAGPMAHPVRPDSFIDISNFYTVTVYNKGAEVVRMIHTLVGADGFRKGTDLYFDRHDGQAVTTDDFVKAMEDACQIDLTQFRLWYSQAGTPRVKVTDKYDTDTKKYTLKFSQSCPVTPKQTEKKPFHIPIKLGLVSQTGENLAPRSAGNASPLAVIELTQAEQRFEFVDVASKPIPSLMRQFSAPAIIDYGYSDKELMFLMAHDADEFNRWDAGQRLAIRIVMGQLAVLEAGGEPSLDDGYISAVKKLLMDEKADKQFRAFAVTLPNETYLAEQTTSAVDPVAIHKVRNFMQQNIASKLREAINQLYQACDSHKAYRFNTEEVGRRKLRNRCLSYLTETGDAKQYGVAIKQFEKADNMTDAMGALAALVNHECDEREKAFADFYQNWQADMLVVDKWFSLQSRSDREDMLDHMDKLVDHPAFDIKNPNKVRAVIGGFVFGNPAHFHDLSGRGYELLKKYVIELNKLNPQMSARLATGFSRWRKFDESRQKMMQEALREIKATPKLAKDVYEIVSKSLGDK